MTWEKRRENTSVKNFLAQETNKRKNMPLLRAAKLLAPTGSQYLSREDFISNLFEDLHVYQGDLF
jgi:hypothetical protein